MKIASAIKLILTGVLLIAAGAGIRAAVHATSEERLRPLIVEAVRKNTGANLSFESLKLGLDGVLRIRNAGLSLPQETRPFLTATEIRVATDRFALLQGQPTVTQIVFVSPFLRLTHQAEGGAWNIQGMSAAPGAGGPSAEPVPRDGVVVDDATVELTDPDLFSDKAPRLYSGLHATISPIEGQSGKWRFEGAATEGPERGTTFRGWIAPTAEQIVSIEVSYPFIMAGKALWERLPYGKDVWELLQLEGLVGGTGRIEVDRRGALSFAFTAEARNAVAMTPYFPARLHRVNGSVQVTDDGILIGDVEATIAEEELEPSDRQPTPAQVHVSGFHSLRGAADSFTIDVADLPVCRKSVEAIPNVGPRIWQRLQPAGRCRLHLALKEEPGGHQLRFAATAGLEELDLRPQELPWPIRNVTGTVRVDDRGLELSDVRGTVRPVAEGGKAADVPLARITADGRFAFDSEEADVTVEVQGAKSSEGLFRAIPGIGSQMWEQLRPEVLLDARVLLAGPLGGSGMAHDVTVNIHGGTARPKESAAVLADLTGRLTVRGSKVYIEHLEAALEVPDQAAQSPQRIGIMTVRGLLDLETGETDIQYGGRDLLLTEGLVNSVPEVGRQIWGMCRPTGTVSLDGAIRRSSSADRVHHFVDLDLRDASMMLRDLPLPITSISGQALITDSRIVSNEFAGLLSSGRLVGNVVVSYGPNAAYPSYAATLDFNLVDLGQLLAEVTGTQTDLAGQLTGRVYLGGFLSDPRSLSARGQIALTDGLLWESPFFAQLLSVLHLTLPHEGRTPMRGNITFALAHGAIQIDEFEVIGGGLDASGRGTVGLDQSLKLTMIAVGAPEKGRGIPIVSDALGWLLSAVEQQLVHIEVTGTLSEPKFQPQVLSKITWPLVGLRDLLAAPFPSGSNP
jgi:hypothetical protein